MTPATPSDNAFPEVPVTADELTVRWATRDAEYAKSRTPLDPETVATIRSTRMREAGRLPNVKDRARMHARAQAWAPPSHQEYGSLKEWLE